ncbi:RagB/SusD family nutrient uptake outer membrane protein [Chryseobacterium salipaludis]|uniref:RagB/SusD family nutrient uptake outer membrane protein n=1 Tax=Chryseobacterium TaxID=59732 RepID=UPI001FF354F8|nr:MULTISPECIES: RagB/SusD family nutrient uptake outer membrane protein [Chryseobacterium]MCJ8497181.1 RagB/SusD family nutrient uptake outer membrane protein [Chryseobacterium salipaludis]MCX3295588.1 RagB/SusD family nutrient uptake outer membrane protein [Planobacterium sp. JC490]
MKKLVINVGLILLTTAGVSTLNSCKDALEIVQPGELNPDAVFTNVSNLEGFLNGAVYAAVEPNYEIYLSAVLTDEVKPGKSSGGQEFQLHRFFLDKGDALTSNIWLSNYTVINRVNRLLEGATKFTPASSELAKYNSILAQARLLRAFAYLELQTYFSENMKDDNGLGVIIVEGVPETANQTPRSSNKEVFDVINADLEYARGILKRGSNRYYADLNFVEALAARVNLYRGKYAEAKINALSVLNNSGLALTPATPIYPNDDQTPPIGSAEWNAEFYKTGGSFNPYRNIWNDSSRGEVIFALNRQATGVGFSIGTRWNTNQSNITGSPMWNMGRNLFNIIDNTDGDIRRYAFIDPTSTIDPNYLTSPSPITSDQIIIDKYPGIPNAATRNDIKVIRLSEIYFILAECAVSENNLGAAADYIQQVRVARNYKGTATTPAYSSKQVALADILKERRVELAFEGHRLIDLKRLAVDAGVEMDRNPTDDIVTVSNLPNGSYKYTLPIPISETAGNPNIQQNTGYSK